MYAIRGRIESFISRPMASTGAACLRIGYGVAGTVFYIGNYSDRRYLWGPNAVYPFEVFRESMYRPAVSIYEVAYELWMFETMYHLGLIVAVCFTIGVGGRVATAGHYLFLVSLYWRNPALLDGGDNLAYIVLLFLIPVNTTSVLALRCSRYAMHRGSPAVILHNTGIILIAMQLFVVYVASAMFKIQGRMWQDGTALYYILKVPEFSWPPLTEHLTRYALFVTLATYFTVLFQMLFPVLVALRETRVAAILISAIFHAAIALMMGLTSFSIYVVSTEAILLADTHYKRFAHKILKPRVRKSLSVGRTQL